MEGDDDACTDRDAKRENRRPPEKADGGVARAEVAAPEHPETRHREAKNEDHQGTADAFLRLRVVMMHLNQNHVVHLASAAGHSNS